jgi:hypothetical protein
MGRATIAKNGDGDRSLSKVTAAMMGFLYGIYCELETSAKSFSEAYPPLAQSANRR